MSDPRTKAGLLLVLLSMLVCTGASTRRLSQGTVVSASTSATSTGTPSRATAFALSGIFPLPIAIDVYILADTTGSMAGEIAQVQADATNIVNSIISLSSTGRARVGVGQYRDVGDDFVFMNDVGLQSFAQPAIDAINNEWEAEGGGDFREGQFFALEEIATRPDVGFEPGDDAVRIVVWFGDAPGQIVPVLGSTEATATAALVASGIRVLAIDVGSLDLDQQASRIADATGGLFLTAAGVPDDGTTMVSADAGDGGMAASSATGQLRIVSASSGGDSDSATESGAATLPDAILSGVQGILLG